MRKTVLTRADTYRHELCEVRIYNTTNDYIKTRQSPSLPEEDVRIEITVDPKIHAQEVCQSRYHWAS